MTIPTKEKVARIRRVADGLRRIQEFESAAMLDSYAAMLEPVSDDEVFRATEASCTAAENMPITDWHDRHRVRTRAALESFLAGRAK